MFLKQLDQFMLQYYSFKAENIAKQQKCRELWYIFAIIIIIIIIISEYLYRIKASAFYIIFTVKYNPRTAIHACPVKPIYVSNNKQLLKTIKY
jgi:hypothetical protein